MKKDRQNAIREAAQSSARPLSNVPELSILIPTYNRSKTLQRTLEALEKQGVDFRRYEIVVVDDGSTDDSAGILSSFAEKTDSRFFYAILKENGGPAKARNIGLALCKGSVILNLGDDIEPSASMVKQHLDWHLSNPDEGDALLGRVTFPDELKADPFMHWLEHGGRKYFFNYAELEPHQPAGPIFFYTCNVSLKASLLAKSGWFDESFAFASHEDLELGYRLADKGMRLVFDPEVLGCHWHRLTIDGIARRVYLMGYSAFLFWEKVGMRDSALRQAVRKIIAFSCSMPPGILFWNKLRAKKYSKEESYPLSWHILLFISFFLGLSDADNGRPVRI